LSKYNFNNIIFHKSKKIKMKKTNTVLLAAFVMLICNFTFSIDNCFSQWQPEVRLTNDPAVTYNSFTGARSIAASGSYVHTTFTDDRAGNFDVYYKRSIDGGATFEADRQLTSDLSNSHNSAIAVSGSNVCIVWYDSRDGNRELYYKVSNDNGDTWTADTRLTNNSGESWHPSVTVNGSIVQIVWFDDTPGNNEIFYKRSNDGGNTWSADLQLSNTAGSSKIPGIAVSGSVVHVCWYDSTAGNWEIYYKRSTDGGTNWGADTRLTNNIYSSIYPTIAVSGSTVHIAWADNRNGPLSIFYKRSTNGGLSWGSDIAMVKQNQYSNLPSLAVNGSIVHLVFQNLSNNADICYKKSTNGGASWGSGTWGTQVQLTNNSSASEIPSIAVAGSNLHVVFRDDRDGNAEMYYKRFIGSAASPMGLITINSGLPKEYSLSQNYPNPFNPVTKINFNVPKQGFVTLKVYDVLGREVSTLVNEVQEPGSYSVDFNGASLTSGVYFYRLESNGYTDIKKMSLIK
jgi:hypothetical protein